MKNARWLLLVSGIVALVGCGQSNKGAPTAVADGKHVAYAAKLNQKVYAVVDGKESPAYDDIAGAQIIFDGNEGFHYIGLKAAKDKKTYDLVLVEEKFKGGK